MKTAQMETFIWQINLNWPQKPLFNYLSDIDNNATWQSHVVESEWIKKTPARSGSLFKEVWLMEDKHIVVRFRVEASSSPYRRTIFSSSLGFRVAMVFHLSGEGDQSLLRVEVKCEGENPVEAYSWLRHTMETSIQRLKTLVDEDNEMYSDDRILDPGKTIVHAN